MRRLGDLVTTFVALVTTAATDATYEHGETGTRTYPEPPALVVENRNGAVAVSGEDRADVALTITTKARSRAALDGVRVVVTGGEDVPLVVETESGSGLDDGVVVDLEIALPTGVPVERVETENGVVEVTDVVGDARLETQNGTVTAERVDGYLDLRTGNGTVTARDVAGIDRVETGNGGIDVELDAIRQDVTASTRAGTVTVRAGPDLDADVVLSTRVGEVDAPAIGRSGGGVLPSELTGTLGDGGHRLRVESQVGAVELLRTA